MGPHNSKEKKNNFMSDYDVIQNNKAENISYLQHKRTEEEYLLREFNFNDKKESEKTMDKLSELKNKLAGNKHVTFLKDYLSTSEDQYCSTFYKIYALFQYPQRTLDDEINQRNLQKRNFSETQLWSILASCILGLSHLQKNGIKHSSLKSNRILLSQEGIIKVSDPYATGSQPIYQTALTKRTTPHLYLSPEQTNALQQQILAPNINPFKSDIWTLGMIILEAGLLGYQDECYRDELSRIHWQTLQYNIDRFGQAYSQQIKNMIEFMLSRDERVRPDWLDLEEHVMKSDQGKRSMIKDETIQRTSTINDNRIRTDDNNILLGNFPQPPKNTDERPPNPPVHVPIGQTQPQRPSMISPRNNITTNNVILPQQIPLQPPQHLNMPMNMTPRASTGHDNSPQFIRPSIIDQTRPLRNIFPSDKYILKTKIDENLIVVDDEDEYSSSRGFTEAPSPTYNNYNSNNYPNTTQLMHRQSQQERTTAYSGNQHLENRVSFHTTSPQNQYNSTTVSVNNPPKPYPQTIQHLDNSQNNSQLYFVNENFSRGSRYQGYKLNNMRHGQGKFYYQDGGMYDGEWRHNKMEGYGKLYYQSGKLAYEGYWKTDQFMGNGVLYNEIPDILDDPFNYNNIEDVEDYWVKYQGEFIDDMKNGHGILLLSNGQKFEGNFVNDCAEGNGIFYRKNGERVLGRWQNNIKVQ